MEESLASLSIAEDAPEDEKKVKIETNVIDDERLNVAKYFPWHVGYQREARTELGVTSWGSLIRSMRTFRSHVVEAAEESYSRPGRARILQSVLSKTLSSFHYSFDTLDRKPNCKEAAEYLRLMSFLVAILIDLKIKASHTAGPSLKRIAQEISFCLNSYLQNSEEDICDCLLRCRFFTRPNAELVTPVIKRFLSYATLFMASEITYFRFILTFKLWRKLEKQEDERRKITKKATEKLIPSAEIIAGLKNLPGVEEHLPKNPHIYKGMTMFLLASCNFNFALVKKSFLELYSSTFSNLALDRPRHNISALGSILNYSDSPAIAAAPATLHVLPTIDDDNAEIEVVPVVKVQKPQLLITLDDDEEEEEIYEESMNNASDDEADQVLPALQQLDVPADVHRAVTPPPVQSPPPHVQSPPPHVQSPPPHVQSPPPHIQSPPPHVQSPPPHVQSPPPHVQSPPPHVQSPPPHVQSPPPHVQPPTPPVQVPPPPAQPPPPQSTPPPPTPPPPIPPRRALPPMCVLIPPVSIANIADAPFLTTEDYMAIMPRIVQENVVTTTGEAEQMTPPDEHVTSSEAEQKIASRASRQAASVTKSTLSEADETAGPVEHETASRTKSTLSEADESSGPAVHKAASGMESTSSRAEETTGLGEHHIASATKSNLMETEERTASTVHETASGTESTLSRAREIACHAEHRTDSVTISTLSGPEETAGPAEHQNSSTMERNMIRIEETVAPDEHKTASGTESTLSEAEEAAVSAEPPCSVENQLALLVRQDAGHASNLPITFAPDGTPLLHYIVPLPDVYSACFRSQQVAKRKSDERIINETVEMAKKARMDQAVSLSSLSVPTSLHSFTAPISLSSFSTPVSLHSLPVTMSIPTFPPPGSMQSILTPASSGDYADYGISPTIIQHTQDHILSDNAPRDDDELFGTLGGYEEEFDVDDSLRDMRQSLTFSHPERRLTVDNTQDYESYPPPPILHRSPNFPSQEDRLNLPGTNSSNKTDSSPSKNDSIVDELLFGSPPWYTSLYNSYPFQFTSCDLMDPVVKRKRGRPPGRTKSRESSSGTNDESPLRRPKSPRRKSVEPPRRSSDDLPLRRPESPKRKSGKPMVRRRGRSNASLSSSGSESVESSRGTSELSGKQDVVHHHTRSVTKTGIPLEYTPSQAS